MTTRQLKVSDDQQGDLRQNLYDGTFSILLEYNLPSKEQPLLMALEPGLELARYAKSEKRISSMVLADPLDCRESYPFLDVAGEIRKASRKLEMIAQISGAGLNDDALSKLMGDLYEMKFSNVVLHTGNRLPDHSCLEGELPETRKDDYMDLARMLYKVRREWPNAFIGCLVNPYKYTIEDTFLQYYGMVKKMNTGADYFLTQAGWDMAKLHELQWYQRYRGMDEPVIARFNYIWPGDVSRILEHEFPGMVMARELAAHIQRMERNPEDYEDDQLKRLAMQIVGARLMGYSGVQIAGIYTPDRFQKLLDQTFELLDSYQKYEDWVDAWNEAFPVNHRPFAKAYYVFANALHRDHLDYDRVETPINDQSLPDANSVEQMTYKMAKLLHLDKKPKTFGGIPGKLLSGTVPGQEWHLEKTMLLCAARCPKALEEGACESSYADGTCEFGHQKCFYHDVMHLANTMQQLEIFEDPYTDDE